LSRPSTQRHGKDDNGVPGVGSKGLPSGRFFRLLFAGKRSMRRTAWMAGRSPAMTGSRLRARPRRGAASKGAAADRAPAGSDAAGDRAGRYRGVRRGGRGASRHVPMTGQGRNTPHNVRSRRQAARNAAAEVQLRGQPLGQSRRGVEGDGPSQPRPQSREAAKFLQ
jgi:hypothetical protein